MNAATSGDTIAVGAGTFHENVTIGTAGLTIVGDGDATVIQGTFESDNGIAAGAVGTFLQTARSYNGASGDGIDIDANDVTIQGLKIDGFTYGIRFQDGATTDGSPDVDGQADDGGTDGGAVTVTCETLTPSADTCATS